MALISNNSEKNLNNISTWSYKYKRAPLLTQITGYFNFHKKAVRQELESLFTTDINDVVDRRDYLTKNEQYIYITPSSKILVNDDLKKYSKFIELNPDFYMNTDEFIHKIKDMKEGKIVDKLDVDTKRVTYLNKIHLNGLKHIEFNKFVGELNKLNLKDISEVTDVELFIKIF